MSLDDRPAVAPGFRAVRDAFDAMRSADPTFSGQLAVYFDGVLSVDIATPDVGPEALIPVFSASKGLVAAALAVLWFRSEIELDSPVSEVWPEFAEQGKEAITLRDILSHRAGLPALDGGLSLADVEDEASAAQRLAKQAPLWRPEAGFGYHPLTVGILIAEIVRRTAGVELRSVHDELRSRCGAEAYLGYRGDVAVAPVSSPAPGSEPPSPLTASLFRGGVPIEQLGNSPIVQRLGPLAFGAVATARGLARYYAAVIARDEPLVPATALAEFTRIHSAGTDLVTGRPAAFGLLFQRPTHDRPLTGYAAFGHDGAAGALAIADPSRTLSVAFVGTRIAPPMGERRADELALIAAECADAIAGARRAGGAVPRGRPPGSDKIDG